MKNEVLLILGSNLGSKKENIEQAYNYINKSIGEILKKSEFIETEPWGYESSNNYINSAIKIKTNLSPIKLLKELKEIEQKMGRKINNSTNNSYEDRTIDIDIVHYNNIYFYSKHLKIPHKAHTEKRNFSKNVIKSII